MKSRSVVWIAVTAAAALTAGCVDRPVVPETTAQPLVLADQNRDGKVTRGEAKVSPALMAEFDQFDVNNDNELSQAEFARFEASHAHAGPVAQNDDRLQDRPRTEYPRPQN